MGEVCTLGLSVFSAQGILSVNELYDAGALLRVTFNNQV